MVRIKRQANRTAEEIYDHYVKVREDWRRPHLGASVIGSESCGRKLWYGFRWASARNFEGRMLRLFERGHREELWIVDDLKSLGWDVEDVDPETGDQRRVEFLGGHFSGSTDGQVLGVPEAKKTWHLLEIKTANKKWFDQLLREKVGKAMPAHYAQMQVYMHGRKLKRALYICVCKDDDRIWTERVHYDKTFAEATIHAAQRVILAEEPLSKISKDPSWFECKYCDHRPICHLGRVEDLERNCRTCASATVLPEGGWRCDYHKKPINTEDQKAGCNRHLFIPSLLPWEWVDFDHDNRVLTYRKPDGSFVADKKQTFVELGIPE